jgi:hypothetical protein
MTHSGALNSADSAIELLSVGLADHGTNHADAP